MPTELQELRDTLMALSSEPVSRFIEIRSTSGIDYRTDISALAGLIFSLEEQVMWANLEREKALTEAAAIKATAKDKSKAAGQEVARLKSRLKKIESALAKLSETGSIDSSLLKTLGQEHDDSNSGY